MGLAAAAFLLLLIAPVLQAQYGWGVKYTNGHIFAVKGSTVNISCTYIYPEYHKVTDKFWFLKKRNPNFENLTSIPEYSGRVENICDDKINRCTLIIRNLTESDSTVYMFRFITDQDGKYYGKTGVSLRVSDLQVIRSTQNLSCGSCSLTPQQNCNLFKTEQKILGNIYYAAPEDNILTDDCTCRIEEIGHSGVSVEAATSTSTEICVVKGSTVDISCNCQYPSWLPYGDTFWVIKASDVELSSNSHHSYTCFKEYLYYQSKYNYRLTVRITNVHKNDSAVYKFMIRTNTGGWRLTGETGVRLTVPDPVLQVRVSRQESSNRSELTCQSQCGASLYSYIWYKNDEKVDGATRIHDVSLSINSSARYSCTVIGYESFRSPAVYAPEGPLVSVSPSGEVEEDTTITLNCSSDANPAANYSWYKEGENSSKSSEQNFVITQVTAKDSGRYSCRVWNLLGHSESTVNVTVVPVWPWKLAAIGSGVGIFLIGLTGVFVVLFRKKNTHKKSVETKVDISSKLEDEYTSVHFPKAQTDLCSNVKTSGHLEPKHVEEEDVQYSEVSFHRFSSAPRSATALLPFILKLLSLRFSLFLCFVDIFAKAALLTLYFPRLFRTTGAADSIDAIYSTVK